MVYRVDQKKNIRFYILHFGNFVYPPLWFFLRDAVQTRLFTKNEFPCLGLFYGTEFRHIIETYEFWHFYQCYYATTKENP